MDPWIRLCSPNAGALGSIPGWGTKILHAAWCGQKKKKNLKKKKSSTNTNKPNPAAYKKDYIP